MYTQPAEEEKYEKEHKAELNQEHHPSCFSTPVRSRPCNPFKMDSLANVSPLRTSFPLSSPLLSPLLSCQPPVTTPHDNLSTPARAAFSLPSPYLSPPLKRTPTCTSSRPSLSSPFSNLSSPSPTSPMRPLLSGMRLHSRYILHPYMIITYFLLAFWSLLEFYPPLFVPSKSAAAVTRVRSVL